MIKQLPVLHVCMLNYSIFISYLRIWTLHTRLLCHVILETGISELVPRGSWPGMNATSLMSPTLAGMFFTLVYTQEAPNITMYNVM